MPDDTGDVTTALRAYVAGEAGAEEQLYELIYDDLRRQAHRLMRNARVGHSLQPTELVHEAYPQLLGQRQAEWEGSGHFKAIAYGILFHELTRHERRRAARKRGGDWKRADVDLARLIGSAGPRTVSVLDLDAALERLRRRSPRCAEAVELRHLAGLSVREAACVMGIAESTVKEHSRLGRVLLGDDLREAAG